MNHVPALSVAVALLLAGCTMNTTVHEYPARTVVVHDTVYVETEPEPEQGSWTEPDPGHGSAPGEIEPPSGRVVFTERLDPGTATVETVIDHDSGITSHTMYGNALSDTGLRFELNTMVILHENGDPEYFLVPQFSTLRNWETVGATGLQQNDPGSAFSETGIVPDPAVQETVLLLKAGRFTWEFGGEDLSDFHSEGLAIGRYEVTVRIPVTLEVLTRLGTGSSGAVSLDDAGEVQEGTISEDNFVNFGTFAEDYL